VANCKESVELSNQTPLLSNLNMCENIALIREVHQKLSQEQSNIQAKEALIDIGLEHVCHNRVHQCTPLETFYVMVIRALMCDVSNICVVTPYSFVKKLGEFESVLATLQKLKFHHNIIVIDVAKNLHYYRNCSCNIER
jgi:ABC-type lipoprotein export system ATPase subunit